jgi:hypothetical protein
MSKKTKTKKDALKEMLQEIQKPAMVESKPLSTAPKFEMWKKIQFKDKKDNAHDAHIYHVEGDEYYVSQNKGYSTFCHAQTWIINKNQII